MMTNRMTEADYERERAALPADKKEAGARFEQELARLLYRSGWTQEQLAKKEGGSQQRMAEKLRFGRFLEFTGNTGISQNPAFQKLTESKFNGKEGYWRRTSKGDERDRFKAIMRLMQDETTLRKAPVNLCACP